MLVLIMIDECGDEVEVARFDVGGLQIDEDYLEMWKWMKIDQFAERFEEARGFYFEDRRSWNRLYGVDAW